MFKKSLLFFFALNLFISTAFAETLSANVDRPKISVGETFNLTLTVDAKKENQNPDPKPLMTNFDILATAKSVEMNIVNGQSTAETHWIFTLSPKKPGNFLIPSITLGNLKTQPISIEISPAGTPSKPSTSTKNSERVILEATARPLNPYVQSQVIYTVRVFTKDSIQNGTLTDPVLPNASLMRISDDINYQTTRQGQPYGVVERRYAIFPQQSGKLTIQPPILNGDAIKSAPNTYAFGNLFMGDVEHIHLTASPITLDVLPIPANFKFFWIPTTQLTLSENWSTNTQSIKAGEPIIRTVTLRAIGLAGEQLPALPILNIADVKVYPTPPVILTSNDNQKITGTRSEKIAFIPNHSGQFTLPEIKIPWWNTQTHREEIATIPARTIFVQTMPGTNITTTKTTSAPITIKTSEVTAPQSYKSTIEAIDNKWIIVIVLLLIAWGITLIAWWRQKYLKYVPNKLTSTEEVGNLNEARASIKRAHSPQETKLALLKWAAIMWPEKSLRTLGEVSDELQDSPLKSAIKLLDQMLYSNSTVASWDPKAFWKIFEDYQPQRPQSRKNKEDPLPPLYPK